MGILFITVNFLLAMSMPDIPPDSVKILKPVTINAQAEKRQQVTQNVVSLDAEYIGEHFAGSLMQSLEDVPGVKAVAIGSGLSRPIIRGFGYNRMVVSENGVKHEGQQWGDDHGLEIDQFAIDEVSVIKGPAALLYGSDAIGGVLKLTSNRLPSVPFEASVTLLCRSVSSQLGFSTHVAGRSKGFFYKANFTLSDYGDYRVPTDSIQYYSYNIPLQKGRLRNTAGGEYDGRLMVGWTNNRNFRTDLMVTDVYARSGFYADAHGMEVRLSKIDYDRSTRDIDLPYQQVNHFKMQSHTLWQVGRTSWEANMAWQHNYREEFSEPISHGYMPTPPDSLERSFDKHTLIGTLDARMPVGECLELNTGISAEYQQNRRGGWGFVIPDFENFSGGLYAVGKWTLSDNLTVIGGMRYDLSHVDIHSYRDWYRSVLSNGDTSFGVRSLEVCRTFNSFTWSLGANWHRSNSVVRANVGKAFRVPIAKELGADGINYHIFRYEQGNPNLNPEESYQLDIGVEWFFSNLTLKVDPYFNYFPNYIYLTPTPNYKEGLQLYDYTQTQALRYGVEVEMAWLLLERLNLAARGQYCRSTQLTGDKRGYTLPFAVPTSADIDASWHYLHRGRGSVGVNVHTVMAQDDIVPPEKPTPGYATLNFSATHYFLLRSGKLSVTLRLNNLLDAKYYDHTSYYRLMDIPEPGRNLSVRLKYEFTKKQKEDEVLDVIQ